MAVTSRPRESKGTLEPLANTYAVENGMLYDYYPVKLGERNGDFIKITKLPPLMREGYVTYQRKLYKVTIRDFLRSRVNVGQPAYDTNPGASASSNNNEPAIEPTVVAVSASSGQPELDTTFGVQVNEAANLAFEDQVRALLYLDDSEEEWVYETPSQSGLVNAGSAV